MLTHANDILLNRTPRPAIQTTPIFQQDWWLTAAGGDDLERATVKWDGHAVASLAFVRRRRAGLTLLEMPPYTRTLGVALHLPESKPARRMRNTHAAVAALIEQLPAHDRLQMTLEPGDQTAFSLALAGCSLGQQFTFVLPAGVNIDHHWSLLDQKTRNLIRSSSRELTVQPEPGLGPLLALAERRHGKADRSDAEILQRLAAAAVARDCMLTLSARTHGGEVAAVAVLVWDDRTLFFWQSSRDPAVLRSGATSLLVWHGMLEAHQRGLTFDIDGYHSLDAARFVSRFGLLPQNRTSVLRLSRRGRVLQALGRALGRGTGFGVPPLTSTFADL